MEPNSLEWMTAQRDRLKQEVDALNPKYDAAVAKLTTQERDLADAAAKVDNLTARANAAEAENATLKASLAKMADANTAAASELAASKAIAEQRRLALADIAAKVAPLVNQ